MSSQVYKTTREGRRQRSADTLDKLLTAGEAELRAVGFESLTMRTVAARAGVSPATAYTYLASKNHLFAELFLGYLAGDDEHEPTGTTPVERVQSVTRRMAELLADAPQLAAAATPALLSSDPDVDRLRVRVGVVFVQRFEAALDGAASSAQLETLVLAFSGALLQAGMGVMTYAEMGDRLDTVVETVLRGVG